MKENLGCLKIISLLRLYWLESKSNSELYKIVQGDCNADKYPKGLAKTTKPISLVTYSDLKSVSYHYYFIRMKHS